MSKSELLMRQTELMQQSSAIFRERAVAEGMIKAQEMVIQSTMQVIGVYRDQLRSTDDRLNLVHAAMAIVNTQLRELDDHEKLSDV